MTSTIKFTSNIKAIEKKLPKLIAKHLAREYLSSVANGIEEWTPKWSGKSIGYKEQPWKQKIGYSTSVTRDKVTGQIYFRDVNAAKILVAEKGVEKERRARASVVIPIVKPPREADKLLAEKGSKMSKEAREWLSGRRSLTGERIIFRKVSTSVAGEYYITRRVLPDNSTKIADAISKSIIEAIKAKMISEVTKV